MATKKKRAKPRTAKPAPRKRVKAGTSKAEAAHRKILYAHALLANNGNKTQAAVTAGYKPGRASEKAGQRLSQDVVVQALIREGHQKAAALAGVTVERTLLELARMAYSDPRKLKTKDGKWIALEDLSDDAAGALASMDEEQVTKVVKVNGKEKTVAEFNRKIKLWDKNSAIEKAMKYHKLYADTPPPASFGTVIIVQAGALDDKI